MEKLIYKYDEKFGYWTVSQSIPYPKSEMILLQMSFNGQHYWINVDIQGERVTIWDSFDEEDTLFENISKLKMSKKNYEHVLGQWNQNMSNPALYLIFSRDNNGWINLETKQSLSQDDLDEIKKDVEAALKHEQRR